MPLKLQSAGGGAITLDAPSTAASPTITFPANTGTVVVKDANNNLGLGTSFPNAQFEISSTTTPTATFTASISGTTLDVTAMTSGTIALGDRIFGSADLDWNTYIVALGTGTGGVGTYIVNNGQNISSTTLYSVDSALNVMRFTNTDTSEQSQQTVGAIEFFGSDSSTPGAGVKGHISVIAYDTTPDYIMLFGTSNGTANVFSTERMRIEHRGRIGINTRGKDVSARLHVIQNDGTADTLRVENTGNASTYLIINQGNSGTVDRPAISMRKNDNILFGLSCEGETLGGACYYEAFNQNGSHVWYTNGTEKVKIISSGYLKGAGNGGTYVGSTTDFHEFNSPANYPCTFDTSTNATFTDATTLSRATRAASSAYFLYSAESGGGADREFGLRGDGQGYADGSWNGGGADYAEFFESSTGLPIAVGTTVVFEGNKVRAATNSDSTSAIVGVVRPKEPSRASMIIGNTAWNKWVDKYLTDDFGRYIMEDHLVYEWTETIKDESGTRDIRHSYESHKIPDGITVPEDVIGQTHDSLGNKLQHYKLNPDYDPTLEYVPREKRDEWLIIGLLGQVPILNGQPISDRWIKMRDISASVSEYLIR